MTTLILGSRTYQPLSDVTATPGDIALGESDVARQAELLGAIRKHLEPSRKTLLELAPKSDVVLYVANDPRTKQPTTGMQQIMTSLLSRDIEFRRVDSPLPGSVCEMITNLRHAVDATVKALPGGRRDNAMAKALSYSAIVVDERDKYVARLEEGWEYEVGNDELDAKYLRWLRTYECLCDSLKDAERML